MNRAQLIEEINRKQSFLCVGLDPDLDRMPERFRAVRSIFEFNKWVIDQVAEHCVAFKPNTAFYECYGQEGWGQLEQTVRYIREQYPTHFVIADAKRGDIGNTSKRYAEAFFKKMDCHAITVAPYMGEDSIKPFLEFEGKWVIVLGLTSNIGSLDFQFHGDNPLHLEVIQKTVSWGGQDRIMIVAGATRGEDLIGVRKAAGQAFLLVPGIGAQGGNLEEVVRCASIKEDIGLLINSSRGIIYADSPGNAALNLLTKMRATRQLTDG